MGCEDSTLFIDVREHFAKLTTFLVRETSPSKKNWDPDGTLK
jgi:hypothetical protein